MVGLWAKQNGNSNSRHMQRLMSKHKYTDELRAEQVRTNMHAQTHSRAYLSAIYQPTHTRLSVYGTTDVHKQRLKKLPISF